MTKNRTKLIFLLLIAASVIFSGACTTMGAKTIPLNELKKKYAYQNSRYVTVNGLKVHYLDEGEGPVLLLLHGVCASLHTWDGWVKELKGSYRIIRFDNMGFGLTGPAIDPEYTIQRYVKFLDAFTTALKLKKFSIAGNSLGGYISWNYALSYPEKIEKMILIDSVGYTEKLPGLMKLATFPLLRPLVRKMMPRALLHKAVTQVYGDKKKATPRVKKRYFELAMRKGNKNAWVDIFVEMKKQAKNRNLSMRIKDIRVPTLVMWGKEDLWLPVSHVPRWRKDLPGAKYIVYEGIGHVGMEEIPVRTARDARSFLEGKSAVRQKTDRESVALREEYFFSFTGPLRNGGPISFLSPLQKTIQPVNFLDE